MTLSFFSIVDQETAPKQAKAAITFFWHIPFQMSSENLTTPTKDLRGP
jgi:hypothetical protein